MYLRMLENIRITRYHATEHVVGVQGWDVTSTREDADTNPPQSNLQFPYF